MTFKDLFDLLTGYRQSIMLQTAVNSGLFETFGPEGRSAQQIAQAMNWHTPSTKRFLDGLVALKLLGQFKDLYFPTPFAKDFLLANGKNSQLATINFEKELFNNWQQLESFLQTGKRQHADKSTEEYAASLKVFLGAMDEAAQLRSKELWERFAPEAHGVIVEIGAGSGAYLAEFLEQNPGWQGVFCDLDDVIELARKKPRLQPLDHLISYIPCNLLDASFDLKTHLKQPADIILYSNVVHCQSMQETDGILKRTLSALDPNGVAIVHDFFKRANPTGTIYDLHMMLNTYNGQTYTQPEVASLLRNNNLLFTEFIELPSASAALFATSSKQHLPRLGKSCSIKRKAIELGFEQAILITPSAVPVHAWVQEKCKNGCENYGRKPSCPPAAITHTQMKEILSDYQTGLMLVGEPPLKSYQEKLLELEKFAFLSGYPKALAYSCGPCSLCTECNPQACKLPAKRRSSLEACGVDVFQFASNAGINLKPLKAKDDIVTYVSLLLLE